MKRFMILHVGFEPPTQDVMAAWQNWFEAVKDHAIEHGGFGAGREISADGTVDLPWGPDCLTGYSIVEAEDLDTVEKLARGNPFVTAIRIYELRGADG